MIYLIIAVAVIVAIVVAVSLYFVFTIFGRTVYISEDFERNLEHGRLTEFRDFISVGREWLKNADAQEVRINSFDNTPLCAKLICREKPDAVIILMHGFHSDPEWDFASVLPFFSSLNYDILLPWQRACGKSGGRHTTFGIKESGDFVCWVNYVIKRYGNDVKILADGVSMGCATVLYASGTPLPPNVRAIVADCGFTSPKEIITHVMKNAMHLPRFPLLYTVNLACRIIGGFDFLRDGDVTRAVKKSVTPTLFVHGEADDFVPPEMTLRSYEACAAEKELITVPLATHGASYLYETELCQRKLREFFGRYL